MDNISYVDGFDLFGIKARQIPCLSGKGEPNADIAAAIGLLYIDEDTGDMYKSIKGNENSLIWTRIANDSSQSSSGIIELIKNDMLPAIYDSNGAILTDENGNIIGRF